MFLSSYENNIDKKGRVSVPASFRSRISSMGFNSFIAYPSFSNKSLECCTQDRIEKLSNSIDTLNPFEEKRDFFGGDGRWDTLLGRFPLLLTTHPPTSPSTFILRRGGGTEKKTARRYFFFSFFLSRQASVAQTRLII